MSTAIVWCCLDVLLNEDGSDGRIKTSFAKSSQVAQSDDVYPGISLIID